MILEEDVFVGPAAVFTNDGFPRAARADWELLPDMEPYRSALRSTRGNGP